MQKPMEEAVPGSSDSDGSGWNEEPSQLEEFADFMEQVWAFSLLCFNLIFFFMPTYFKHLTLL